MATIATLLSLVFLIALATTEARIPGFYYAGSPHGAAASGLIRGARRNQNLNSQGYGGDTAELFNSGHWCPSICVTATNFCPQNDVVHNDNGGWCNPAHRPQSHFHLAMPMFLNNDENRPAFKFFNLVLITNVAGAGDDMVRVSVKGTKTGWMPLSRNWGQNRQLNAVLVGQSLSFRINGGDVRRTVTFYNIIPCTWQFRKTRDGQNTHSQMPTVPIHVQSRKLFTNFHSIPAHFFAGITHARPIHAYMHYWKPGPGFGTQGLESKPPSPKANIQGPESGVSSPSP